MMALKFMGPGMRGKLYQNHLISVFYWSSLKVWWLIPICCRVT